MNRYMISECSGIALLLFRNRLICRYIVESLQSYCIHTQSHWSGGSPVCFPSWGTRVQSPGGYIGDPDVIDHCGLVWGGLRPKPSLCRHADIHSWSHTAFVSHRHSQLLRGSPMESLQSHCIHTHSHWPSGSPVSFPSWGARVQSPGGYLRETGILLLALSHYNIMSYPI